MQGCFAKVNRANKVEFYLLNNPNGTYEQINANSMNSKLEINKEYGPVNVVSFTMKNIEGENVTLKENTSITTYGETTIEVQDNPFMVNQSTRESTISALYGSLVGFQYTPTVFNYKARLYNDCGDKIQVYDVDSETYVNSLILNQTIVIPATRKSKMENKALSKTQVKNQYISKTEQEGSHTEIMVDKQNQKISSVVSQVTEQNNRISQINQTVDEINTKISDIADITKSGETSYASLEMDGINESEPIYMYIYPITENISFLYPRENLYPSDTLYMTTRTIRFLNTDTEEIIDYEIPYYDLLTTGQGEKDFFYLDYESQTCYISKKCGYNADGTVHGSAFLPVQVPIIPYPTIHLEDGDYEISLLGYGTGYIKATLMASNIYTTQFATKIEVNSAITQKADEIDLEVNEKLTNYSTTSEMNSAINIKAGEITSTVSSTYETKTNATQKYSQLQQTDSQISTTVGTKVGKTEVISWINQTPETITINANRISLEGKEINLTSGNTTIKSKNFNVDRYGNLTCSNANITNGKVWVTGGTQENPNIKIYDNSKESYITPGSFYSTCSDGGIFINNTINSNSAAYLYADDVGGGITIGGRYGNDVIVRGGYDTRITCNGNMYADAYNYISLEEKKKNIEKYEKDAISIITNSNLYEFNYKTEEDNCKKHIGFVIGEKYKTPKEVISQNGDSINSYSMNSIMWKAIQEQQNQIEILKKEIEKLKGGK